VHACVDLTSDKNHCGSCPKACTAIATCTSSQCVATYGSYAQLPNNNLMLLPNAYGGIRVFVDTNVTVQKVGINLFTFDGSPSAYIAIYQEDASGVLHLKVSYGPTSITAGRNEFNVAPTALPSGSYWIMVSYSNTARPYSATSGNSRLGASSTATFSAPVDPFPSNASSSFSGDLNYYFIAVQ
jgi:hypothetical protein